MLGYNDLLSRPSIELNTIWEPTVTKKSVSPSGERTIAFEFVYSIGIVETVSLERQRENSICSIFLLCMKMNVLEKST